MEKILITGATGFLGSTLSPYLKNCGHNLVTHANTTKADFMFDLSDKNKTNDMLTTIQPTIIINLVALTNVELCEDQINLAYLINTRTVENIANWILLNDVRCHLVQISTDQVYDGTGYQSEDDIRITNNYALTKYAGELAASTVGSTILRTNFVGRSRVKDRKSLTDWVYSSIAGGNDIELLEDVYFSPLSLTTIAEMIDLVLRIKPKGTFNMGSHGGLSKAEFILQFVDCLNLPTTRLTRIKSNQAKFFRAYRPKDMRMDSSRFESMMGVKLPSLSDLVQPISREYK